MKRWILIIAAALCLLLCLSSCGSSGGELEKRPGTVENNRVIGAEGEEEKKPSSSVSSSAQQTPPAASTTASSFVPPATQQSGTVRDEQNAGFRLRLEWTSSQEGENVTVNAQLFLDCYSLTVNSSKSGYLTVNGQKYSFRTEKISVEENSLHSIPVCDQSFTFSPEEIPAEGISVEAQWNFKGSYGGQAIEALTLQETIELGRNL